MDQDEPLPLTPRGRTGMVLHRTRSQEDVYAQPMDIPVAAYPPDMAVRHLGQQVRQAVDAQGARIGSVQQAVGAQTQHTYEQLLVLHQQQQVQAREQMEMNQRLMDELVDQRDRLKILMDQLSAQRATAEHHAKDFGPQLWRPSSSPTRWKKCAGVPVPDGMLSPLLRPKYRRQRQHSESNLFTDSKKSRRLLHSTGIALANARRPGGQQIMLMPLSGCIDPLSVERIAYWEIGKASHELTEDDWRTYFLGARECNPVDMTKLCQNMSKLKMDGSIQSAESRVSKLVSDFEAILVRLSMEGFAESEPKLTVDFLMAAITPPVVQKRVKELMKLNENRSFKKDARAFKTWLSEYMRRYGEFEPLVQAVPAPPKTVDPPKGDPKPRKQKVVAVINVDKVPLTNFIPANGKSVCFKCLNLDHGVFQCTMCAPGEAQLLMNRAKVVWAEARTNAKPVAVVTKVVQPNEDSAVMCAARVVCTASQAVALDASFDSGADQSVMPPSTLRMLQDAGHDLAEEEEALVPMELATCFPDMTPVDPS
ncbi:hypothetical protein DYB28_009571 [Aphanomyces astaci]|uniref:Peptidase A2 domain-containing protein n=1 Tax=Aphanomyces astaci TaxID=112090 RepID=A0A9X8DLY5_APHAT|nr:hypothetical protein DYB28_009571 [Aphanomyces astaci]